MGVEQQDVIIVGAGPAGGVLSILLARSGVKVALLEQDTQLDRGFRGPAYQPSALRIWKEMGIFDGILDLDHSKFSNFTFLEKGKELISMDVSEFPKPFNFIMVIKQAHLLRYLIKQAACYPNFTYLGGVKATGLIERKEGVKGVTALIAGKETILHSRLVVAADGRFSAIRQSAEIPLELINQNFDVVWFELPHLMENNVELGFHMTEHGFLVFLPKEKNTLQIGLVLGKGSYSEVRKQGLEALIQQIVTVEPPLEQVIRDHLVSWEQCELLDVKMGIAEKWCKNGLVLIGDSAHIASPVGGIGNKLAIEDAALVHPIIVHSLKNSTGIVPKEMLQQFEENRRKDIEKSLKFQKFAGKVIMEVRSPILKKLRSFIAPKLKGSPFYKKVRKLIAWSPRDVHVDVNALDEYLHNSKHLYYELKVTDIIDETPSAKSFVLEIPQHLKELFRFKAGQFITVRDLDNGVLIKRCYSLSEPEREDCLRITVKRQERGNFSNYLHEQVQKGHKLLVSTPAGGFTALGQGNKHTIFLAGGSGITPVYSLICSLLESNPKASISLFNINKNACEAIFHKELRTLESMHQNFHVCDIFTEKNGRPDRNVIEQWISDTVSKNELDKEYYLCGPHAFMNGVELILKERGCSSKQVHVESFSSAAGLQESIAEASRDPSGPLVVGDSTIPLQFPKTVTIKIGGNSIPIDIQEGETILDACLRSGVDAPFSCQEGICSTCKALLVEGRVIMDKHEALSEEDIASRKILTCRAKPQTEKISVKF